MKADNSHEDLHALRSQDGRNCNGSSYRRLEDGGEFKMMHAASSSRTALASAPLAEQLDQFFEISARGSSISIEVRSGCIAWMTMSYIMVVNPVILSKADPTDPRLVEPVMTATSLAAASGSLLVGLLANAPLGLMPGMGLNAYFAFGICRAFGVSWREAMTCCFVSGLILVLFACCGVCQAVVRKVLSDHLKKAITVAIGLFQALIGFQVMGLVIGSSDTMIAMGDISPGSKHWQQLYLSIAGLCIISALLVGQQLHGALLLGIWGMAASSWLIGLADPPSRALALPRFDAAFCLDFQCWMPGNAKLPSMIVGTLVLLFVALFDLAGVQYGLFGMANLLERGAVPRSNQIFASAGLSTMIGALLGTSPIIIANESSAGIMEGAKTGLSALVVAVLFLLSAFITPLLNAIPHVATAVPLVLIGAFMMAPCRGIDWDNLRLAIPSFLTITVVPFTYSIHNGIIAGILMDLFLDYMPKPKDEGGELGPKQATPRDLHCNVDQFASPPTLTRRLSTPHSQPLSQVDSSGKAESAKRLLTDLKQFGLPVDRGRTHNGVGVHQEDERSRQALVEALEAYLDSRDGA